jgi:hypothetical protein
MSKKKEVKKKRKRGRPEKIVPGIPASLDELAKAMFAPVREEKTKEDQYIYNITKTE